MKIGRNYEIESDEMNVTLFKREKKNGKLITKTLGYYSSPQNALKAFVDLKIKETQLKDFKIVCAKIDELHHAIDNIHSGALV